MSYPRKIGWNVGVSWTNWTFGVWWDRKRLKAAGVDLGPLEITYRWPH